MPKETVSRRQAELINTQEELAEQYENEPQTFDETSDNSNISEQSFERQVVENEE